MEVIDRDLLPLPTTRKGKKSKKVGAKGDRAKGKPKGSLLGRARVATTAATLGAGVVIGAAIGAVLGRRR